MESGLVMLEQLQPVGTVWVYDQDRVRRGVLPALAASATIRHNAVSNFIVDAYAQSPEFRGDMRGWFVQFTDDAGLELAGVVTGGNRGASAGVLSASFNCETFETYLDRMISLPTPGRALDDQTATDYYRATGPTVDVLHDLIDSHIGPGARVENRAGIEVEDSNGQGSKRTVKTRFKNLLEVCQGIAKNDGAIGFRTALTAAGVPRVGWFTARDLTRAIRLSEANGAVASYELTESAPTVTRVLVAGQGQGSARTLRVRTGNANDWGPGDGLQTTVFQDRRDSDDTAELDTAGDETLAEGVATAAITLEVNDIAGKRLGVDFNVGDRVTVQLAEGVTVQDTVQSAAVEWSETGRTVSLHVGPTLEDPEETDAALVKRVRQLASRLNDLETR